MKWNRLAEINRRRLKKNKQKCQQDHTWVYVSVISEKQAGLRRHWHRLIRRCDVLKLIRNFQKSLRIHHSWEFDQMEPAFINSKNLVEFYLDDDLNKYICLYWLFFIWILTETKHTVLAGMWELIWEWESYGNIWECKQLIFLLLRWKRLIVHISEYFLGKSGMCIKCFF